MQPFDWDHAALCLRCAELCRWLADLSIIQPLEDHKLPKSAFVTTENCHRRLREDTAKLSLNYIRNNFNTAVPYKVKRYSYQYVPGDNVQMLANYISDRSKELHFNVPGVPIKRNGDNGTRARGKGFGLTLIKMLVDDFKGKFWVEDRAKGDHAQGATLVVLLPAVEK